MKSFFSSFASLSLARVCLVVFLLSVGTACGEDASTSPPGEEGGAGGDGGSGGGGAGAGGDGGQTDSPGFIIGEVSGNTTEEEGQATFTVALNSRPADDVVLGVESDDTTEGTVNRTSLTFTSSNWNAPQLITVTGVDDDEEDGDQEYGVALGPSESADLAYNGLRIASVALTNVDNDTAGITVTEISGDTSEEGDRASFTVVLKSAPASTVTLDLESNDAGEGVASPGRLTFTVDNWDAPQEVTVTGRDDAVADGDVEYAVEFAPSRSEDSRYNGIELEAVILVNADDDTAGIRVSAISGETSEQGDTATFTVRLSSAPTANVTIGLSSTDNQEGTVDPISLTFTPQNWNAERTVTVRGVDDDLKDGNQTYSIAFGAATSSDLEYEGLVGDSVLVTNVDNESAGFTLSPISGSTSELGGTATFSVRLNSQPTANVMLSLSSNDPTEGTVSPTTLTFTEVNWSASQSVTVTGVDDALADGNQVFQVVFGPATSADGDYNALRPLNVSVVNVDNESAGFLLAVLDSSSSEAGGEAQVSVRLTSEPTANVVLTFSSSDPSEAIVSGASSKIFTPVNWAAPQLITLIGQDDEQADRTQNYSLVFQPATSDDPSYSGRQVAPALLTNVDDETAGFTVTPSSGITREGGGQFSFTVALNTSPLNPVTVNLASSDTTEGTVSRSALTFTSQNWNAPQSVTVTGVDDLLADGTQEYSITFLATTTDDPEYAAIRPTDVEMRNLDQESPGVSVSSISGNTTEEGDQATLTVVLDSQPTSNVVVTLGSSDLTEGQLAPQSITFTSENWNSPRLITVTGQDDDLADGNQQYSVVFNPTTSSDTAYSGLLPAQVTLFNIDDDQPGFIVSAVNRNTSEDGTQATFSVRLSSQPFASVVLGMASSNETEGEIGTDVLTFTTLNWAAAQTVTITGLDDDFVDGNQPYSIHFDPAASADDGYDGLIPLSVSLLNLDDDTAGFQIVVTDAESSEASADNTASFSVRLTSEPSSDVTLMFDTDAPDEGQLDRTSLTFTPANWSAPQVVTATGVDDDVADRDQPYSVVFEPASSTDEDYDDMAVDNLTLTNRDDDSSGILVTRTDAQDQTTEEGDTATFSVVLNSQPTASVTVNFSVNDATEAELDLTSLTFNSSDWATPQSVTVTGLDDDLADGNVAFAVVFGDTLSLDPAYEEITPGNLAYTNLDDDSAAIEVTELDSMSSESGDAAGFTVELLSEPFAPVTVHFASSDATEGITDTTSLTFTVDNWDDPQLVLVTGQNDGEDDGNQPYRVDFTSTTSTDAAYAALTPTSLELINVDNDTAGISAFALNGDNTTTEAGGTALLGVALNSQPTANVVLTFNSSDTTEGELNITTLTFTPSNWNSVQTALVQGVDDELLDGAVSYDVNFLTITTTDTLYAGLPLPSVTFFNQDDDD